MPDFLQVIIPDSGQDLVRQELALAFLGLGFKVLRVNPTHLQDQKHQYFLPNLLDKPTLFLSVNGQGLSPMRFVLDSLHKSSSRACLWFVDNPWNILAGVREPLWKQLPIFVTDKSFIPGLSACGVSMVRHLPLAACFELFAPNLVREAAFPVPSDLAPFVFVGRSAFPGKDIFFKNCSIPADYMLEARKMLSQGHRPDFLWWQDKLWADPAGFWPGKKARSVSFAAEECSLLWRQTALDFVAQLGKKLLADLEWPTANSGLDIFGDSGWELFLPEHSRSRQAVDYYARLPGIYSKAFCNVALTSLQLPQGLNQRHFDVWAAGGLCLTDNTPGLDIFPQELVDPVVFYDSESLSRKIYSFMKKPGMRQSVLLGWQQCLRETHTYTHRAITILELV